MNFIQEVSKNLFGQDANAANVVSSLIMFSIGAIFVFWIEVKGRDKNSCRTPVGFSLKFLFEDNLERIIITGLVGLMVVMIGSNIVMLLGVTMPESVGRFFPLIAGLSSDAISIAIKRKFVVGNDGN